MCEHASRLPGSAAELGRVSAHHALSALELGLGTPGPKGVRLDAGLVAQWLARKLQPFDAQLDRAATFSLCLAAIRMGLTTGPATPTISQLCQTSLWRLDP